MGCVADPREAERIIYNEFKRCAEAGEPVTRIDDLCAMLGGSAVATPPTISKRLERKGLIRVRYYQRGKQVYVVEIDKWTAPPKNQTPHWRDRKGDAPSIPIQTLRQYEPVCSEMILKAAFKLGKTPAEFISLLAKIGFSEWEADQAEQEPERKYA